MYCSYTIWDRGVGVSARSYILIVCATLYSTLAQAQWTAKYTRVIDHTVDAHYHRNARILSKFDTIPFNQLIVSVNARRPAQGHYTFFARVRKVGSDKWSKLYPLFRFGANGQRTYLMEPSSGPKWHYVRLQMPKNQLGDTVEISAQIKNGATFEEIDAITISTTNEGLFTESDVTNFSKLSSVPIVGRSLAKMPRYSQMLLRSEDANRMCAPTSLAMVTAWANNQPESPIIFGAGVYDPTMDGYGSWPFMVLQSYDRMQGKYRVCSQRLESFEQLHGMLQRGLPVVVSIRGKIKTMPSYVTFKHGHIVVVVGYDANKKRVIVHDPSFKPRGKVLHAYPLASFLAAWDRSRRFAITFEPKDDNFSIAAKPIST